MLHTLSPPPAPSTIASDEYPVSPISASMYSSRSVYSSRSPSPTGTITTTGTGVDCDPRRFFQSVALTEPLGRIVSPGARAMQADAPPLIDSNVLANSVDMEYQVTQPLRVQKNDPWYDTYNDHCVDFYPSASGRFLPFDDDLPDRASISSLPTTPCSPVPVPLPSPRRSSPPPLPILSDPCSSSSIGSAVDSPAPSTVDTSSSPPGAYAFEDSVLGLSEAWEPPANDARRSKRPLPQPPVAASASTASTASTDPIPTQTTTPPGPSTAAYPSPAHSTPSPASHPRASVSSVRAARPLPVIPKKTPVKKLPAVPQPSTRTPVKRLPAVPQPPTQAPVKEDAVQETSTPAAECEPPKRLIPEHTPGPRFSTVSRSIHRQSRPAPLDLGRFSNLPLPPIPDERPSPRSFSAGLGIYYPKTKDVSLPDVGVGIGTSGPSPPSSSSPVGASGPIRTESAKNDTQRRRPTSEERVTTPVSQTAARPSSDPRAHWVTPEEALDEKNYIFLPKHAPRKAAVVLGLDFHDLVDKPTSKPKVFDQVAAKAAKLVNFRGRGRDQAARVGQKMAANGYHAAGAASIGGPNATGVRAVDGDLFMDFDHAGPSSSPWLHNNVDAVPPLGVDSPTKTVTSGPASASTPTFTPPLPPTPTPGPLTSTELAARQNALMDTAYYPDHDDLPHPPSRPWLKGNDSKGSLSSAASKGSSAGSSMPTAGGQSSSGRASPHRARPFSPSHQRNKSSTGSGWSFSTGNRTKDRPVISRPLDQALEDLEPADGWASVPLGMRYDSPRSSMDSIPPSPPPKASPDVDEHRPEHSPESSRAHYSPSYRSHTPSPSVHSFTTLGSRRDRDDANRFKSPRPAPQPPLAASPFSSPNAPQFPRTPRSAHTPAPSPRAPSRQSRTSRISQRAPSRAAPSPTPTTQHTYSPTPPHTYSPTPTTRSLYAHSTYSPTTRSAHSTYSPTTRSHIRSPTPAGRYPPAAPPPDPIEEEEEVSWFEPDTPAPTTTQVMAARMGEGAMWVKHTFNRRA